MSNKTALVTGASDGIGLEFCKILAAKGYDIILVARRKAKLNEVAKSLSKQHKNISCTVISSDLSKQQAAQKLFAATVAKDLQVDLLINNAGLLQNGFFTDLDLTTQENMIAVNISALTSLTHLFANDMGSRAGGHILNVASLAAWAPIPNQNVYAATKAYVLSFSQALHNELKAAGNGVSVTALCPGYTATKMMDNPDQGAKLSVPDGLLQPAQEVAEQGIAACLAGKPTLVTGFANRVSATMTHLFSRMTLANIAGSYYRKNLN
ncbi:MAG: SDR family oxidoreductase [Porticoccaceae bacterium]|nr:SDR family oxidoreductase [Porticoccaceae bacterium]